MGTERVAPRSMWNMADGKWIEGLGPVMPVREAARKALHERCDVVRQYLPLAVHHSDQDLEHVHRLRVGTRRGAAALRIFARWLPEKAFRRARRTLRDIRRAAGHARDWDVFLADLLKRRTSVHDKDRPGIDFLVGYATGQRDAAQLELLGAGDRHGPRLREVVSDTLAAIRDPDDEKPAPRLRDLGRVLLDELLTELDWAATGNLGDYEHLHQVRILGKQLRYAMEVFAGCYPAAFREVAYPRVEEMQEILGLANDSHVANERLGRLRDRLRQKWPDEWKPCQPGFDNLLRFHRRRLPRQRELFLEWWKRWQSRDRIELRAMIESPMVANGELPPK